jgi:hypothetical protein
LKEFQLKNTGKTAETAMTTDRVTALPQELLSGTIPFPVILSPFVLQQVLPGKIESRIKYRKPPATTPVNRK